MENRDRRTARWIFISVWVVLMFICVNIGEQAVYSKRVEDSAFVAFIALGAMFMFHGFNILLHEFDKDPDDLNSYIRYDTRVNELIIFGTACLGDGLIVWGYSPVFTDIFGTEFHVTRWVSFVLTCGMLVFSLESLRGASDAVRPGRRAAAQAVSTLFGILSALVTNVYLYAFFIFVSGTLYMNIFLMVYEKYKLYQQARKNMVTSQKEFSDAVAANTVSEKRSKAAEEKISKKTKAARRVFLLTMSTAFFWTIFVVVYFLNVFEILSNDDAFVIDSVMSATAKICQAGFQFAAHMEELKTRSRVAASQGAPATALLPLKISMSEESQGDANRTKNQSISSSRKSISIKAEAGEVNLPRQRQATAVKAAEDEAESEV